MAVGAYWLLMLNEPYSWIAGTPRLTLEDDASVIMLNPAVVGLAPADFALSLKALPQRRCFGMVTLGCFGSGHQENVHRVYLVP